MIDDVPFDAVAMGFADESGPVAVEIPFPAMRPSSKLSELWAAELVRTNNKSGKLRFTFRSPLDALSDLIRKRGMPTLPWPAQWVELGKRCRLYVGEAVGVVGPSGGGKTSFAIQMAIAARASGIPILWNPKELDEAELDLRIVANMAGEHTARIRDDWSEAQIRHALSTVDDLWRFVDNLADLEEQIEAYTAAIRLAKQVYRRPPLLVIDYVGKLAFGQKDPRLAIMFATESIRRLIVSEECYAVILAQPSRSNNALLTGKGEIESATDAIGVAGESAEIEHACSVMIGLNVFKEDDQMELNAHVLVSKARATGREGRQGFRFSKPGGVWRELDHLPPTPGEIATELANQKRDKQRIEPPTKESAKAYLNQTAKEFADRERRNRVRGALVRAGIAGMNRKELSQVVGAGRGLALAQTLDELVRSGDVLSSGSNHWRIVNR